MNACGDSRLRGLRSRKPIGFRQWVVHKASLKSMVGGGRIDAANTAADHVNIMKKAYELGKNI